MKTENDHINLKVAGQDGSVVQFKIKRHTPLSKLMKAYCERQVCLWAGWDSAVTPCPGCSGSTVLEVCMCVCTCVHWCARVHAYLCVCIYVCLCTSVCTPWWPLFSLHLQVVPISSCFSRSGTMLPLPLGVECDHVCSWISVYAASFLGDCRTEFECSSMAPSHGTWKTLWRHIPHHSLVSTKCLILPLYLPVFKVMS